MKNRFKPLAAAVLIAAGLGVATPAAAHCDTLDGPVVSTARAALEGGNIAPVLAWVRKDDEPAIRAAFERTRAVRKQGEEAKALADTYFFETLVRVHRAGENAPYDGLKPAGHVEPAVAAADKAIETGKLQPLAKAIFARTEQGLHAQFDKVMAQKRHDPNDVEAGRAYASAYVEYVHYAERLYDAAGEGRHATEKAVHAH